MDHAEADGSWKLINHEKDKLATWRRVYNHYKIPSVIVLTNYYPEATQLLCFFFLKNLQTENPRPTQINLQLLHSLSLQSLLPFNNFSSIFFLLQAADLSPLPLICYSFQPNPLPLLHSSPTLASSDGPPCRLQWIHLWLRFLLILLFAASFLEENLVIGLKISPNCLILYMVDEAHLFLVKNQSCSLYLQRGKQGGEKLFCNLQTLSFNLFGCNCELFNFCVLFYHFILRIEGRERGSCGSLRKERKQYDFMLGDVRWRRKRSKPC